VKLPSEEAMRAEYQQRVITKGYGKGFHSLKDKEVEYVDELLQWVNKDLMKVGVEKVEGHTKKWYIGTILAMTKCHTDYSIRHEAKAEHIERLKAMFGTEASSTRELTVTCW